MRFVAAILALIMVFAGATALAHSMIKDINISSGDSFSESPETFEITFSHKTALADIELETASGEAIETGFESADDLAASFSVNLPTLESGDYLLTWKAVARDGHIMTDTIDFSVE